MREWIRTAAVAAAIVPPGLLATRGASALPISEQTPVKVKLLQELKSGHERPGDHIRFAVAGDLTDGKHAVIIPKGTPVVGTITRSSGRRMFGQPGRLEFSIDYIKVSSQVRVPLRSAAAAVHGRNNTGAAIGTAVFLTPVALFVKGRDAILKPGQEFTVFVNQTTEIPPIQPPGVTALSPQAERSPVSLIRLKNGDTLTGTVIEFKAGIYTLETDLGRLNVNQNKIESISERK
jgi:hypothetical protein